MSDLTPQARILCVDDDHDSCEMLRLIFHYDGKSYSFTSVPTPFEALTLIEKKAFDLYIIDYLLPEMDGVELCHRIRLTDKETPIIFYSGMARAVDRLQAIRAGATGYLVKPQLDELQNTVEHLLSNDKVFAAFDFRAELKSSVLVKYISYMEFN
jgi:CheY-like chemotaxis protein